MVKSKNLCEPFAGGCSDSAIEINGKSLQKSSQMRGEYMSFYDAFKDAMSIAQKADNIEMIHILMLICAELKLVIKQYINAISLAET